MKNVTILLRVLNLNSIKEILKYFLVVVTFCGLLAFSSVRNVYATPCNNPGAGSSVSLMSVSSLLTLPEIASAEAMLMAFFETMIVAAEAAITSMINTFLGDTQDFTDQFWDFDLKPAMQQMTAQLHTGSIDASRNLGSFFDAQELTRTTEHLKTAELNAHRLLRPSTLQCQASTVLSGLFRIDEIKDGYARAAPIEQAAVTAAAIGSSGAAGGGAYQSDMWNDYCTRYVDPQSNRGLTGCAGPPPMFSEEAFKAESLFEDTYDVTDPNLKQNVDDWVRNICGTNPIARVPLEELDTTAGRRGFMNGMSHMAQQQLCYTSLYHVQSRRVPGSQMDTEVMAHVAKGGVNPLTVEPNPSWNTIENVLKASTAKDFQLQLVDEPEAVQRFLVVPDIYAKTYGVNEIKDLQERTGALLAVLGARELEAMNRGTNASEADSRP